MPIPVRGKTSPIPNYTGRHGFPSDADIDSWSNDIRKAKWNVAARLTDDLIGIDVDAHGGKSGESTLAACVEKLGPLPDTWRSTARGNGPSGIRLYRVPAGTVLSGAEKRVREIGEHIDIIHMRHRYVMVAPSKHPDINRLYKWHGPDGTVRMDPPNVDDLAELPGPWLEYLTAATPPPSTPTTSGTGAGSNGKPVATATSGVVLHRPGPTPLSDDWSAPIPIGRRHEIVTSRAGVLRSKDRPLWEAESNARGWWTLCEQAANDSYTVDDVLADVRDVYRRYPPDQVPSHVIQPNFEPRNGEWLDAQQFPPLRYHVPGIVPEGFTLLVGAPKIGKSWLALDIALAVSNGHSVLGQPTVGGPVLLLALEDGDRRLQDRCRTLAPGTPLPKRLEYETSIDPENIVDSIDAWLAVHGGDQPIVIVDTLGRCVLPAVRGETTYGRDYRIAASLKALCDKHPGTALISPHHERKAESADFIDAVSGTNGLAGAADTVMLLTRKRHEDVGLLQVTGRDVLEGEYALTFDNGRWQLDGGTLANATSKAETLRATDKLGEQQATIYGFIVARGEGVHIDHVAKAVGLDNKTTATYLGRLHAGGRIERLGRGFYGPPGSASRAVGTESEED